MAAKVINASLVTCRRKTGENQGEKVGGKLSRRLPILLFCLWTWRKSLNFLPRASDFPAPSFSQLPNEAAGKSQRGLVVINNLAKSRGENWSWASVLFACRKFRRTAYGQAYTLAAKLLL